MPMSIQSQNGVSVVTKDGKVKIEGNVKSVRINGNKVINNCVDSFGIKATTFFAGFVTGFLFILAIFTY